MQLKRENKLLAMWRICLSELIKLQSLAESFAELIFADIFISTNQ